MNILTMNQNVFGSFVQTGKLTKNTRKAIKEELIIPVSATELTCEEMEYVDGGWFLGVSIGASACISLFNTVLGMADKQANGYGIGAITANMRQWITMSFGAAVGAATSFIASIAAKLASFLSAYPIVAAAAIVVGVSAAYILGGMIVAGGKNSGFRTGLEFGWFKIQGVCELI